MPMLITTQENATSFPQWGSSEVNTRGESISNFIILNRLNIYNTPTFRNRVREAVIGQISSIIKYLVAFVNLLGIQEEPTGSDVRRLWRRNFGVVPLLISMMELDL